MDNVERLYPSLINVSPTIESWLQVFSLQQYPSGAAVVMHPAFADAVLVEQVVYELGADSNSGSARLATADVPVLIRRAREVRALTDGCGLPPLTALSF